MTRTHYAYAIFFSLLVLVITLFKLIIYLYVGPPMFTELPHIREWVVVEFLIGLVLNGILLWHLYDQGRRRALWAFAITCLISIFHVVATYDLLVTRDVKPAYIFLTVGLTISWIITGLTFVLPKGNQQWLNVAGVAMIVTGIFGLTTIAVALISISARINGTLQTLETIGGFLSAVPPLIIAIHFTTVRKNTPFAPASEPDASHATLGLAAFAALFGSLVAGISIVGDSNNMRMNPDHVPDNVRALAQPFEARIFVNGTDTLRYRLLKPMNPDSTKKYPMVVCLHGSSGSGKDNIKQIVASWPAVVLSTPANREKYPAYLFVPQCERGVVFGGMRGVPAKDSIIAVAISAIQSEFNVDASRCYVAGNSMGGYGAWHMIGKYPQLFAAAIPISGGGDPAAASNMATIPLWAFHGDRDVLVPVQESRKMIEAIKKAGGSPRYTEYAGEGHHIWQLITENNELLHWLFLQQREAE